MHPRFGGHEYPMAGGGANDVHTVWRDEWLGGGFASGMGGKLAEGYPYWLVSIYTSRRPLLLLYGPILTDCFM
jgi:hypothetical protein